MHNLSSNKNPNILFQQALNLHQHGNLREAEILYSNILKIAPSHIAARTMLGTIFIQSERNLEGIKLLEYSLRKDPKQFGAYNALGVGYLNIREYQKAFLSFNKSISLKPDYVDAYFNLGKAQKALGKFVEAINSYSRCISLNSNYADAYSNRGAIFNEQLKEYKLALNDYQRYISLSPNSWHGFYNIGVVQNSLKQYNEALLSYEKAIQLNPNYAEAYCNIGVVHSDLKQYNEALSSYEKAIQLNPNYAEAYFNIGVVHSDLKQYNEALSSYEKAIQLNPKIDYLLGNFIHTKMQICDWSNYQNLVDELILRIQNEEKASIPFIVLGLIDDPNIQNEAAKVFSENKYAISNSLPPINTYPQHKKIRIGYFSADFCEHPVSYLTAELFELHSRDHFEVIAFSFGVDTNDNIRKRLELAFDEFIDVRDKTDQEIAILAREKEIDIAIDLGGYTKDCRTGIFAMRAAPVQLSYIGYLGTMGSDYFEYLIADQEIIPEEQQQFYSERIIYLPSYQVNDNKREISNKIFTREEIGLPENGFVFCCFNNIYKITPTIFDSWMRILDKVNGSVLLLLDANEMATINLKKEAISRGISADRIIFAKPLPLSQYLARYSVADLFLDTTPYNAGTTASDALRMGLPILTKTGYSFASRMAASLLKAVGLNELITSSQEEYESLAIEMATKPEKFQLIKNKLSSNLATSDLYNTQLFTKKLEESYKTILKHNHENLPLTNIYIQ